MTENQADTICGRTIIALRDYRARLPPNIVHNARVLCAATRGRDYDRLVMSKYATLERAADMERSGRYDDAFNLLQRAEPPQWALQDFRQRYGAQMAPPTL